MKRSREQSSDSKPSQPEPVEHPPLITETAFACPHCGAYTSQSWYEMWAHPIDDATRTPRIPAKDALQIIAADRNMDEPQRKGVSDWVRRLQSGLVFNEERESPYIKLRSYNLHLSKCFNCAKIAVWVHQSVASPPTRFGPQPKPDMPPAIMADFEEARSISNLSPRGAAALLRLCIQRLCIHLGQPGKNLDSDIAALVSKGLDPLVQKAFDIVRVIGNESVHPGELDIKDDVETVAQLLDLINSVTEQMISHPKNVAELYARLPESKRKAIEARDAKTPPR